ncbi:MAG: DUF6485 family protein [Oscillospiraceae bacterium]|nr:DUF6485 family protein [Oscillospiraceae bacterium]
MSDITFCTCPDLGCAHHPSRHGDGCTPCVEKNLRDHEIPACFWFKIGREGSAESDYTFQKFAQAVVAAEK